MGQNKLQPVKPIRADW